MKGAVKNPCHAADGRHYQQHGHRVKAVFISLMQPIKVHSKSLSLRSTHQLPAKRYFPHQLFRR